MTNLEELNEQFEAAQATLEALRERIVGSTIQLQDLGRRMPDVVGDDKRRKEVLTRAARIEAERSVLPFAVAEAAKRAAEVRVRWIQARVAEIAEATAALTSRKRALLVESQPKKPHTPWRAPPEVARIDGEITTLGKEREDLIMEVARQWEGVANAPGTWGSGAIRCAEKARREAMEALGHETAESS